MTRVEHNFAKSFPKLADANRQDLAVSMFSQGDTDQKVARMRAIPGKGDVASALVISTWAKAFNKNQQ